MTDESPPIRATLVGRPPYEPEFDEDAPKPEGTALPSHCLRVLQSSGFCCALDCPGVQRDGGCLAELVRGRENWSMSLDQDGFWVLKEER